MGSEMCIRDSNKIKIPIIEQQNKIVEYLDKEVYKIDSLIQKKLEIIAILEEKKRALIYLSLIHI